MALLRKPRLTLRQVQEIRRLYGASLKARVRDPRPQQPSTVRPRNELLDAFSQLVHNYSDRFSDAPPKNPPRKKPAAKKVVRKAVKARVRKPRAPKTAYQRLMGEDAF